VLLRGEATASKAFLALNSRFEATILVSQRVGRLVQRISALRKPMPRTKRPELFC
jgi:hypothetical protein